MFVNEAVVRARCPSRFRPPPGGPINQTVWPVGTGIIPIEPTTLWPGIYPGGIHIGIEETQSANVDFMPGQYWLDGGGLTVYNGSEVHGDGVKQCQFRNS